MKRKFWLLTGVLVMFLVVATSPVAAKSAKITMEAACRASGGAEIQVKSSKVIHNIVMRVNGEDRMREFERKKPTSYTLEIDEGVTVTDIWVRVGNNKWEDESGYGKHFNLNLTTGTRDLDVVDSVNVDEIFCAGAGDDQLTNLFGGMFDGGNGQDYVDLMVNGTFSGGAGDDDVGAMFGGTFDGGAGTDRVGFYAEGVCFDVESGC